MILLDSTLLRMAAYFIESPCFYYDFLLWNEKKYEEKRNIFPFFFAVIRKSSTFAALFRTMEAFGRLAQLVQSICLTSRGSAVRIRQRPQKENLKHHREEKSRSHEFRAFSSAGSEHLPYKQRVGGSNPSTPTKRFT